MDVGAKRGRMAQGMAPGAFLRTGAEREATSCLLSSALVASLSNITAELWVPSGPGAPELPLQGHGGQASWSTAARESREVEGQLAGAGHTRCPRAECPGGAVRSLEPGTS